jgi:flagellin-like protein
VQVRILLLEDDGISPVTGAVLTTAITVILAAVIATFVLGPGDRVSDTAPQSSFDFGLNTTGIGTLTVTHSGGAPIQADRPHITSGTSQGRADLSGSLGLSDDVTAGDSVTKLTQEDDTGQAIWTNQEGTNPATLRE